MAQQDSNHKRIAALLSTLTAVLSIILAAFPSPAHAYDSWSNEFSEEAAKERKAKEKEAARDPNIHDNWLLRFGPEYSLMRIGRRLEFEYIDESTNLRRTVDSTVTTSTWGFRAEGGYVVSRERYLAAGARFSLDYGYMVPEEGSIEAIGRTLRWEADGHYVAPAVGAELQLLRRHLTLSLETGLAIVHQSRTSLDRVSTLNNQTYWMPLVRADIGYRHRIHEWLIIGIRGHAAEGVHWEQSYDYRFETDRWQAGFNFYLGFDPVGNEDF